VQLKINMRNCQKLNRDMRDGNWYWINRAVLHVYGPKLKTSGIAVYNALASFANFKTQACFPTQKVLARLTGMSRRTVSRKIKLLKELGLIKVERKKRGYIYHLLEIEDMTEKTPPCDKKDTSNVTGGNTNNNKLTRNINNNVNRNFLNFSFKGKETRTKEELLAKDLAEELNDEKSLPIYLYYCKKYPESLIRKALGEVKEIPSEKIKKNKAALFNYLIKKYAQSKRTN